MGNGPVGRAEPKIYAAILGVMKDIGAVSKDKTCKSNFGSYKFRGIDDVMNALHPAMVKNGIFVVPEVKENIREVVTTKSGTQMNHSICTIRYEFFADDGSCLECTVVGEGMDTGDKATNKAMSVAFKYACFQTFCIPTEDMDDPDAERPEEIVDKAHTGKKQEKPADKSKQQQAGKPISESRAAKNESEQLAGDQKITEAMLASIRAEQKRTEVTDKVILSMRAVKAKKIEDMTVDEFKIVMKKFELTKTPVKQEGSDE